MAQLHILILIYANMYSLMCVTARFVVCKSFPSRLKVIMTIQIFPNPAPKKCSSWAKQLPKSGMTRYEAQKTCQNHRSQNLSLNCGMNG